MELWGLEIAIIILVIILLLVFIALPLYFTAKLLEEDEGFLKALGTTILLIITFSVCISAFTYLGLCIIGLIIAIIVNLLIIKVVYETDWGEAFVMWIVTIVMSFIITFVVVGLLVGVGVLLELF